MMPSIFLLLPLIQLLLIGFIPHSYFSITYLGDSGVSDFTAVLRPGQAAILTIGSIKLMPSNTSVKSNFQQAMTVTLTADARVYHDELVCKWLDEFKRTVESPDACGLL